jgi:hypothetical protein
MTTNIDAFEVHDASTDAATETSESISTTVEYKYAQLEVPNFEIEGSFVGADTTPSGSSFVRMGSFPDFTLTDKETTDANGTTTTRVVNNIAADAPTGFKNSLILAMLVGDADAIAKAQSKDATPGDSGILRESTHGGDPDFLLGFTDDTRARFNDTEGGQTDATKEKTYIDGVSVNNDMSVRKAETHRLLTKGGWWDHSDGNRVTTTSGDKIEVIQGNYKMVILGRQDPTDFDIGKTAITDFSGGHFQEQYTSPTPAIKSVGWVKDEDGWTLFQDNGAGNVTTKFHGKQVDAYTGSKKESVIGADPGDPGGLVQTPDEAKDPSLISKTWAKKIESYVGSVNKPVPHVFSLTFADAKEDITFAASVVTTTTAATIVSTTAGGSIISTNTAAIDVVSVTAAPLMLTVTAAAMAADLKIGTYYAYGTNTTHVRGHSTTIEGDAEMASLSKTELTALKNDIANVSNALVSTSNHLANTDNRVSSNYNVLAASVLHLAAQINYL